MAQDLPVRISLASGVQVISEDGRACGIAAWVGDYEDRVEVTLDRAQLRALANMILDALR